MLTLDDLYRKLPVSQHSKINVVGNEVIYDSGTVIYRAKIKESGELVPLDAVTRNALDAIGG